jgi:6-pyruvoyltetrahydropterin/6-carboxytetrahydropterin synthase
MLETFVEFTFEAAHRVPPYSTLHGHSFRVIVYLTGHPDPVYGWTHNLYDLEPALSGIKQLLDHTYLNEIEGLEIPTLENVAAWIWQRASKSVVGVDRVLVRRGIEGAGEGCCYRGLPVRCAT